MKNGRLVYNMDKEWKFHFGDVEFAPENSHRRSYNISKAGGTDGPAGKEFNDFHWRTVNIPHDMLCETGFSCENLHSHGYHTRDNGWYRKSFKLDASLSDRQILLCFEGIAVTAQVYLNGSLMARSFSAYAELPVDVTDRVYFGDRVNVLSVFINGIETEGWWYEGAGIYRHVRLYAKNRLHIAHYGLWIKPQCVDETQRKWIITAETTVENTAYTACSGIVKSTVYYDNAPVAEVSTDFCCNGDDRTPVISTIQINNPELWDIESPRLYRFKSEIHKDGAIIDSDETAFGFRTIAADSEKGFILNGRPVKLFGTCNHQDHAGVGVAVPDSIQDYRVRRLKEMGTNAYRCSHNMPSRELLSACDKYGILVMDENRRFECRPEVLDHVETMVRRDRNHPCVVMYSLFNEEPLQNTAEGRKIYARMKSRVLKLDDTRILTGALNSYISADGSGMEMDMVGVNYDIDNWSEIHSKFPKIPLIGSENNSAVTTRGCYKTDMEAQVLSNYDEEKVNWGQTIKQTWKKLCESSYIAGIFIWTGFDYRGEPSPFRWPSVSSQFGVMDTCGFAKDAYYYHKACFIKKPLVHILPHWNWNHGDRVRVMAFTNCDETELFLNGHSLGRKKSGLCSPPEWNVCYEKGCLSAIGYIGGEYAASDEVITAGAPAELRLEAHKSCIDNDGQDAVAVNAFLVDANRITVPDADNEITFGVDGNGSILGVGNGDPGSHEPDNANVRRLFAGRCQAIVQSLENARSIRITAQSPGIKSAALELRVNNTGCPNYIYSVINQRIDRWRISQKTFTEKPDAAMYIPKDDMNSFEPLGINGKYQDGFVNGYKLYIADTRVPVTENRNNRVTVSFKNVRAQQAEVYADGELIAAESNLDNSKLSVTFRGECGAEVELRLLIKAKDGTESGIKNAVMFE